MWDASVKSCAHELSPNEISFDKVSTIFNELSTSFHLEKLSLASLAHIQVSPDESLLKVE